MQHQHLWIRDSKAKAMISRRAFATNTLLVLLAVAVLAGVSLMYLQPEFMVMMSNQLWSCF